MTKILKRLTPITAAILLAASPLAQSQISIPADIGLAVTYEQSIFAGGDAKVSAIPVFLSDDGFNIEGPKWSFIKNPNSQYYIGAGLDDFDEDRGDSDQLNDMGDLDLAINLRLGASWKLSGGSLNLDVGQDVAAHKGTQAKLRYTLNPQFDNFTLKPYVEAQWLSAKITDYYVGVNANEVIAGRAAYEADSDFAFKLGVDMTVPISDKLTAVGGVGITQYGDEIKDSPIVEDSTVFGAHLGMTYRWK